MKFKYFTQMLENFIDQVLKLGDIVLGKVVGKRPFGVFVRIYSLVHGRNLDFHNIDIQVTLNI